ncbi:MAG: TaqI-like C-terminal specificity domain-containing protein, partial [Spirochaetota bacterium]
EKFIESTFPSLIKHLKQFEQKAKKRDDQGDYWWELRHCSYYPEFEKEKVVWGNISYDSEFCFVDKGIYINAPANIIISNETSIKYLIAQMNSKIFDWQFKQVGIFLGHAYEWKKQYVEQVRIPPITPANQSILKQIEALVDKILSSKKAASTGSATSPQADTSQWEMEIDRLVYQLYELTEEEIRIVEGK